MKIGILYFCQTEVKLSVIYYRIKQIELLLQSLTSWNFLQKCLIWCHWGLCIHYQMENVDIWYHFWCMTFNTKMLFWNFKCWGLNVKPNLNTRLNNPLDLHHVPPATKDWAQNWGSLANLNLQMRGTKNAWKVQHRLYNWAWKSATKSF